MRPYQESDSAYLWIASDRAVDPASYHQWVNEWMPSVYSGAWVAEGKTTVGWRPMAFIFGIDLGWMMLLGDMVWMPWTSTRNKIESGLHFILSLKRERVLIMTAETESKRDFLVHLARYGVARRVGTIFSQSGKVAVFQSSAKWAEYSAQQQ